MPSLFAERARERATAVVGGGRVAAAQWELFLCGRDLARRGVAVAPEVLPYSAFVERLWAACRDAAEPALLTARQSRALWQRVIADSPEADKLLATTSLARAAEDAWRRVAAYRIDLDEISEPLRFPDFEAFVRWTRDYRERLADAGWIDLASLDVRLAARSDRIRSSAEPSVSVDLVDFEPAPSERAVLDALRSAGSRVRAYALRPERGRALVVRCADPIEELEAAADWAVDALRKRPDARFAIVLPDLEERGAEAVRALESRLGGTAGAPAPYLAVPRGRADAGPLVGAALNALELLSPEAGFAELSRWLRSPFWHRTPEERAQAASFDAQWRETPAAQLPFLVAYRHAGLRDRMRAATPAAAARLDAALRTLEPLEAARLPSRWAALWARALDALGGLGQPPPGTSAAAELERLERALLELATLSPIVGEIGVARALVELERSLDDRALGPLPISGIHVLAELHDVGPGYAGVWVTGSVDTRLPAPVRVNPFLPLRVQRERGIPWSSPEDALRRSRELVARVLARTPIVVFSWPARIRDETTTPSPLIAGFERAAGVPRKAIGSGARCVDRAGAGAGIERIEDSPPAMAGRRLAGGAAALSAHAVCPIRAFCEYRLGARPLASPPRGLPPGLQGRALHGALERFFGEHDSHAALAAAGAAAIDAAIRRAARRAVDDVLGPTAGALTVLADLEAERIAKLLTRLVACERARAPFRVDALERETSLEIRGKRLELRIDRIDVLEDGTIAILDYKSSLGARPGDWLGDRPRDVQLPLYATSLAEPPGAVVLVVLRADRVGYAGVWTPDAFPGRPARLAPISDLVEAWRAALDRLVEEYAAGDVRIFVADAAAAAGAFAPLTRVYEQLALAAASDLGEGGAPA